MLRILRHKMQENEGGASGGGAPAPAAPFAPSSNEGGSSEPSFDFGSLAHDDGNEPVSPGTGGTPTPAPVAQPSAAPAPVAPVAPVVSPAPVTAPPVPPVPAVGAPAAPPQGAAPTPPTEAPPSLEEVSFEKHRETFLPKLAELYKLTDAEAEQLRTDPVAAMPQLAAKLHYEVQLAAYNSLVNVLPQLFEVMTQQREQFSKANDAFYDKWPALKDHVKSNPQNEEVIRSCIKAYKNANRNATTDDVIARAGMLAMLSLNLPLQAPQGNAAPVAPGAAPAAPVVRESPARPPGIGAVGHIPATNMPANEGSNIFAEIVEDYLNQP